MFEINPYTPPKNAEDAGEDFPQGSFKFSALVAWSVIFFANLIIPLLFANEVIISAGWLGVLVAVCLFYAAGCWLCLQRPQLAQWLKVGATVVAVTQLVPLIHIIAGLVGLASALWCGQGRYGGDTGMEEITTELGGWIAATVTGMQLAGIAFVIGAIVNSIRGGLRQKGNPAQTR